MKIHIKATNIDLTSDIKDYVEKKLSILDRYIDSEIPEIIARVNVGTDTTHHQQGNIFKTDINLDLPGKMLRAESKKEDLYASIDEAKDNMERQINKHKKTIITKKHRAALMLKRIKSLPGLEWFKRKLGK